MGRVAGGEVRTIAPQNNVYTAIAAGACVIVALGILVLFMKAANIGGLF